jgi:hypothetical protein
VVEPHHGPCEDLPKALAGEDRMGRSPAGSVGRAMVSVSRRTSIYRDAINPEMVLGIHGDGRCRAPRIFRRIHGGSRRVRLPQSTWRSPEHRDKSGRRKNSRGALEPMTVPRLELSAAVLLARLVSRVQTVPLMPGSLILGTSFLSWLFLRS